MRKIDKSKIVGIEFVDENGTIFSTVHSFDRSNSLRVIKFNSIDEIDGLIRDLKRLKKAINDGYFTKE